jgi:hypothetical protein
MLTVIHWLPVSTLGSTSKCNRCLSLDRCSHEIPMPSINWEGYSEIVVTFAAAPDSTQQFVQVWTSLRGSRETCAIRILLCLAKYSPNQYLTGLFGFCRLPGNLKHLLLGAHILCLPKASLEYSKTYSSSRVYLRQTNRKSTNERNISRTCGKDIKLVDK